MSRSVDVSVVIVSWNVASLLKDCIQSIITNSPGLEVEVIVVDNASQDDTLKMLQETFPWVKVIANQENAGFARANNQGFCLTRGRYILILNPDTLLLDKALTRMVEFMEQNRSVGMAGPKICFANGKVQATCARLLPTLRSSLICESLRLFRLPFIGEWIWRRYFSPYDYGISQMVEAISGAAMLVTRDVIQQIGGFGESFVHCGEDVDLCFRVRQVGFEIAYRSEAVVIHYAGQSARLAPVRTAVNAALSDQEYFRRCFGRNSGFLYKLIVCIFKIPVMVMIGVVKLAGGLESKGDFRLRVEVARAVWLWRLQQ